MAHSVLGGYFYMCECLSTLPCLLAYEKALMVTSTEKEKAYILTSLALLQHRLGNMDSAKTLLFKWSVPPDAPLLQHFSLHTLND